MTDRVVVNRDRTALLPPNSPQKGYYITRKEAADLGLLDSADKPVQERRTEQVRRAPQAAETAPAPRKRQKRRTTKR